MLGLFKLKDCWGRLHVYSSAVCEMMALWSYVCRLWSLVCTYFIFRSPKYVFVRCFHGQKPPPDCSVALLSQVRIKLSLLETSKKKDHNTVKTTWNLVFHAARRHRACELAPKDQCQGGTGVSHSLYCIQLTCSRHSPQFAVDSATWLELNPKAYEPYVLT